MSLRGAERRGNLNNFMRKKGDNPLFYYEIATLPAVARNDNLIARKEKKGTVPFYYPFF